MKFLTILAALAAAAPAFADTPVSLDQFVDALAKDPNPFVNAEIKTKNDPVTFELPAPNNTLSTVATPGAFFTAARAKLPRQNYASDQFRLVSEFGRLTATKDGNALPAVYDLEQDILGYQSDAPVEGFPDGGYVDYLYRPLSIVGSIVSYSLQGDSYGAGAAHPNSVDTVMTVNLAKVLKDGNETSFEEANLAELVDETSLVEALKADKDLNGKLPVEYKQKLAGARNLQEVGDIVTDGLQQSDTCYNLAIYEGKVSHFAIYDYDATKNLVSVRMVMEAAAHVCQAEAPTLFLELNVKPRFELEYMLKNLQRKQDGLLMKNAK